LNDALGSCGPPYDGRIWFAGQHTQDTCEQACRTGTSPTSTAFTGPCTGYDWSPTHGCNFFFSADGVAVSTAQLDFQGCFVNVGTTTTTTTTASELATSDITLLGSDQQLDTMPISDRKMMLDRGDCMFSQAFINERVSEGYTHVIRFWDNRRWGPGACSNGFGGSNFNVPVPVTVLACSKVNQLQNNGAGLTTVSKGRLSTCGGFDNANMYCFEAEIPAGDACVYGQFNQRFSAASTGVFLKRSTAPTFTNHGYGVCCSGRNEIVPASGTSTREQCEAQCAADATCVSYEYHNEANPCQMSTSCTLEVAQHHHTTCSLYTKD
jgi:hypothetical protein